MALWSTQAALTYYLFGVVVSSFVCIFKSFLQRLWISFLNLKDSVVSKAFAAKVILSEVFHFFISRWLGGRRGWNYIANLFISFAMQQFLLCILTLWRISLDFNTFWYIFLAIGRDVLFVDIFITAFANVLWHRWPINNFSGFGELAGSVSICLWRPLFQIVHYFLGGLLYALPLALQQIWGFGFNLRLWR